MNDKLAYLIRDAIDSDIPLCLNLQHTCETEYVWQVTMQDIGGNWQIHLREDRLPRIMQVEHISNAKRLHIALEKDHCFLIAANPTNKIVLGYLLMTIDQSTQMGLIRDVVVDGEYRRRGIASRLLRIAKQWAIQQNLIYLQAETQTVNYPTIQLYKRAGYKFCGFNDQYFHHQGIAVFFGQIIR